MKHSIVHVALVVRDYDEAIEFYMKAPYGTVCVFEDLYGNRWDLVQYGA